MDVCFYPFLLQSGVSFHHDLLSLQFMFHVKLLTFSCGLISVGFLLSQGLLCIGFYFSHHLLPGQRHFLPSNRFSSQNLSRYALGLFSFKSFCSLVLGFQPLSLFSLLSLGPLGFIPLLGLLLMGLSLG